MKALYSFTYRKGFDSACHRNKYSMLWFTRTMTLSIHRKGPLEAKLSWKLNQGCADQIFLLPCEGADGVPAPWEWFLFYLFIFF